MAKKKYIPCDIYNRNAWVFIGKEEEFKKWVTEEFVNERERPFVDAVNDMKEDGDLVSTVTIFDWLNGQGVIWLTKFPNNPEEIGLTVHEITHLCLDLLDFCNVEYAKDSKHEAFAYLAGWIAQNAFDKKGYEEINFKEK